MKIYIRLRIEHTPGTAAAGISVATTRRIARDPRPPLRSTQFAAFEAHLTKLGQVAVPEATLGGI